MIPGAASGCLLASRTHHWMSLSRIIAPPWPGILGA
jgi:hypothetical protein